jgi:hypothetical protein
MSNEEKIVNKKYEFTVSTLTVAKITAAVILTKFSFSVFARIITPSVEKMTAKIQARIH